MDEGSRISGMAVAPARPHEGQSCHPSGPDRRKQSKGWLRRGFLEALTTVAPPVISAALRVLAWTVHIRYLNAEDLFARWERGEQVIVAFWHNRTVMMPIAARGRALCIMN